ncbi:MAG: OmpA family protein [Bacteroidota bacterium]|nr:OmpA family protein [Candidatus Kapabacteria bacterium]MDW8219531.1 OmpA family protein [Bacteroidota bacterium]
MILRHDSTHQQAKPLAMRLYHTFYQCGFIICIWSCCLYAHAPVHLISRQHKSAEPVVQWASKVIRVTSQLRSIGPYSAFQLLGKPNILSRAGETNPCSWASAKDNNRIPVSIIDHIRVEFTTPVTARQVAVAENLNPGAIIAILVRGSAPQEVDTVYTARPQQLAVSWRMLNVFFEPRPYKVGEVELILDVGMVPGLNEIDAIAIGTTKDTIKPDINLAPGAHVPVQPENLGNGVNSTSDELFPIIAPDGKTLYFCRKNHPENIGDEKLEDIWYSELEHDTTTHELRWGTAKNIGAPLNNRHPNFVCGILPDGNTLLVGNVYLPNGNAKDGISLSYRTRDGWSMPERQVIMDYQLNRATVNYSLAPDGKTLLMALDRNTSLGGMDLFVSFLQPNGTWSPPLNLGRDINTAGDETTVFLASDGMTLYFSSDGHNGYGSNDIFMSRRLDSTWQRWTEPQNLGPAINTPEWDAYFSLPASGEFAYFVSYRASSGKGDIYRIAFPDALRPRPVTLVSGRVLDARTKAPIGALIRYESLTTGREIGIARSDSLTGAYAISLPVGELYGFRAEADTYVSINENIDLRNLQKYQEIQRDLRLVKLAQGQSVTINNIFFDTGKWELRPESAPELRRIADLLQRNPSMSITIAGYTDNIGSKKANLELSHKRARAVMEYFIRLGIESHRLAVRGFGANNPVSSNQSEEGRQLNRRVEFIIEKYSQ